MVCQKCSNKLKKSLITPEFNLGSNKNSNNSFSLGTSSKEIIKNKLLTKRQPILGIRCVGCNGRVEGANTYCLTCSFTKGICEMCGKKLTDTCQYKFTDVDIKDSFRQKKMINKTQNLSKEILKEKGFISSENKFIGKKRLKLKKQNKDQQTKIEENKEKVELIYSDGSLDEYDEVIPI